MTLSSPARFSTNIPFPQSDTSTFVPPVDIAAAGQIDISACSEFTKYHTFVDYYKKSGKLRLIHDATSKPVVFVINKDEQLCVLQVGARPCEGWSCTNITPQGLIARTYDVAVAAGQLVIAVACEKPNDAACGHQLFFSMFALSQLDENLAALAINNKSTQVWKLACDNRTNPLGSLTLSSVLCMVDSTLTGKNTKFRIVVGTAASNKRIATLYTVDPNAESGEYWSILTYPAAASAVAQVEPLVLGQARNSNRETGLLSRFTDFASSQGERLAGHVYAKEGGIVRTFEMKTAELGDVQGAFSHLNPWGLTDVFVAGEKGIGFYSFEAIDVLAADPILPDKSFVQTLASEAADPEKPTEQSKIALFALSNDRSLYYIEGTRDFKTRAVTFQQSGMPIREGVFQMSTMYSASYGTSELLYTESGSDKIRYMRRNPTGNLWTEDDITSKGRTSTKFDAYITSVTLTDSLSKKPASNFPVKVSSENIHVAANGITTILSPKPTTLFTDLNGSLTIVIPSNKGIGCPALTVSVADSRAQSSERSQFLCQIEPSGRVDKFLNNIRSIDDLKNAKSSSNTKPFQSMDPEVLESAAGVLQNYREARNTLISDGRSNTNAPTIIMGEPGPEEPSFWQKVEDSAVNFLGDAIEFLRKVVKKVVKVIIVVAGPVVRLLFKLAGKWISFQIKVLYNLLSAIGTVLHDVFGYDGLNRLLEYCRLAVDPTSIIATQKVIKDVVTGSIELTGRIFEVNRSTIADVFEDGALFLRHFIDDPREAPKDGERPASIQVISDILNNPFVKMIMKINPVSWIMEAIMEEIPGIQLPDIGAAFDSIKGTIGEAAIKETKILDQVMTTIMTRVQQALSSPSQCLDAIQNAFKDVFWTLFDSLRNFMESVVGIMGAALKAIRVVMDGVWKIPGVTDLWEDFAGQDFSILNFFTFGPAMLMNFTSLLSKGTPPFQDKQVMIDFSKVEVKPFYSRRREHEAGGTAIPQVSKSGRSQVQSLLSSEEQSMIGTSSEKLVEATPISISGAVLSSGLGGKAGIVSFSERQVQQKPELSALQPKVLTSGFSFTTLNIPPEIKAMAKHLFQALKYFAFAVDNAQSIAQVWQTEQEVQQEEDQEQQGQGHGQEKPETWLAFFKLIGNFLASLMLFVQGLPHLHESMDFGHGVATILGIGGVGTAVFAFVESRNIAPLPSHPKAAEYEHETQRQRAKLLTEISRWLGWIGSTIHTLETEAMDQPLTYLHLASPALSAGTAIATYINTENPSQRAKLALALALLLSLINSGYLGGYYLGKAIGEL